MIVEAEGETEEEKKAEEAEEEIEEEAGTSNGTDASLTADVTVAVTSLSLLQFLIFFPSLASLKLPSRFILTAPNWFPPSSSFSSFS